MRLHWVTHPKLIPHFTSIFLWRSNRGLEISTTFENSKEKYIVVQAVYFFGFVRFHSSGNKGPIGLRFEHSWHPRWFETVGKGETAWTYHWKMVAWLQVVWTKSSTEIRWTPKQLFSGRKKVGICMMCFSFIRWNIHPVQFSNALLLSLANEIRGPGWIILGDEMKFWRLLSSKLWTNFPGNCLMSHSVLVPLGRCDLPYFLEVHFFLQQFPATSKRWQEDVEMEEEAGNWEKTKAELFDHQSSALFLGEILIILVDTVVSWTNSWTTKWSGSEYETTAQAFHVGTSISCETGLKWGESRRGNSYGSGRHNYQIIFIFFLFLCSSILIRDERPFLFGTRQYHGRVRIFACVCVPLCSFVFS